MRFVDDGTGGKLVPLTQADLDQQAIDAAAAATRQQARVAEKARIASFGDTSGADIFNKFKTLSAADIDSYIDTNVVDLASARAFLKKLCRMIAFLASGN